MLRAIDTRSLAGKLVWMVVGLILIISTITLLIFPARMSKVSRAGLERHATSLAAVVSRWMAPSLFFEDAKGAAEALEALKVLPDVEQAAVYDASGVLFVSFGASTPAQRLQEAPRHRVDAEPGHIRVWSAVEVKGQTHGWVVLTLSTGLLRDELRAHVMTAGSVSLGVLLLGLVFAVGLGVMLTRPLLRLVSVARLIASSDLKRAEEALGGRELVERMAQAPEASTNEVLQLSRTFARMLKTLRELAELLTNSTGLLNSSVEELRQSLRLQADSMRDHALALRDTQLTTRDVQRSSSSATQVAESVRRVAEQGERVSRVGESTLDQSLRNLADIHAQVKGISTEILMLREQTRRVGNITGAVKDLADQSYILALNGAMEAARSGEHGAGFTVVARDLRVLSDESIQRTKEIQRILTDIVTAIQSAVSTTESGAHRVEGSVDEVRASGETLRELAALLTEIAGSVQSMVSSIGEQDAGIHKVLGDIDRLERGMEQNLDRLAQTDTAVEDVSTVAKSVHLVVQKFRV